MLTLGNHMTLYYSCIRFLTVPDGFAVGCEGMIPRLSRPLCQQP